VDYPVNQSAWRRGWNDTKRIWTGWLFWVFEAVVATVIGNVFAWHWGVLLLLFGMFCVWLVATAAAPIKQRNEARTKVAALEKEEEPCIEVHPFPCKRGSYEQDDKTACAMLKVKNTSSEVDLKDVSVQILEVTQVYENQNEKGISTGTYSLYERYPKWIPANVYWDSRSAIGSQFDISIPRGDTKLALIAFHRQNSTSLGFLNTPTYPPMQEFRIVIAISSPNMNTWQGVYYIEYLPPGQDKFDFVEWGLWCKSHQVIDRQDSQTLPKEQR